MVSIVYETFAIIRKKCICYITNVCKVFSFVCYYFVAIKENDYS